MVLLSLTSPGGRNPLSRSSSHSWPSRPGFTTLTPPSACPAMAVCRQNRSAPYSAGTSSASCRQAFTVKMVPVSAFSGWAPSGLMGRPSRQVPVHSSTMGSFLASSWLS